MPRKARWLLFAVLVLASYLSIHLGWLDFVADENRVANYLHGHGATGYLVVILGGSVFTGIGAPRQLLAFILGFAMGGLSGTLVSSLATAIGAAGCFFAARWLLRDSLTRRFGHYMNQFDALFRTQTLMKVLLVRLLPVGSNLVTNLVAGSSGIRFTPFLVGSILGYLPQMLVFALAGAGIGSADKYQLVLSAILFVLATLIGTFLYYSHRGRALANSVSDHS